MVRGSGTMLNFIFYFSLGAEHDGYKNYCKSSDHYLMTDLINEDNPNYYTNGYFFSTCSIQYFEDQLSQLGG